MDTREPRADETEEPTLRRRALRWAREIALTLVVGVAIVFGISWLRAPDLPTAPDFTLLDLEGRPVTLSDYRGQTVIVNFWATWCGPCRIEAPSFSAFAAAHPDVPGKVSVYPTTFVVNPDGSMRWIHTGMMVRPMIAWSTGRLW